MTSKGLELQIEEQMYKPTPEVIKEPEENKKIVEQKAEEKVKPFVLEDW